MIAKISEDVKKPWSVDKKAVLVGLNADISSGLNEKEVERRLEQYGRNKIDVVIKTSILKILIGQFLSPFVLLLAIAAGLSFYFDEWLDGIAIVAVIVINGIIGFMMELQAERSMEALKKLTTVPAKVKREGRLVEVSSEELVPGDIMFMEAGDMVTADARIFKCSQLQSDESALTGESIPVEKQENLISADLSLADRNNMVYKGTFITKGNGYAVVVHTGMSTELGSIARMVENAEQAATPLEKKIQMFSTRLIRVTVALVVIIFIAGLVNGRPVVQMLETSIALAVAAIPEGLPIVTTLALAFGMLRMARHNVIVKRLSAVETLGGTSVICTDKTGTLTQNKIEASFVQMAGSGSRIGLNLKDRSMQFIDENYLNGTEAYKQLVRIAALCSTASYKRSGERETETGDPLEVSLLKLVYCSGGEEDIYRSAFPKQDEVPFSSESKVMATLHKNGNGYYIAAKGAVEELLTYCTYNLEGEKKVVLSDEKRKQWLTIAEERAKSGLRMLGFAYGERLEMEKDYLHDLTFAGQVGFIDPPRKEVPAAIAECKTAGIKVVMITGDHPATAKNIAMQLGIAGKNDEVIHGNAMKPYKKLSAEEKKKWLEATVFARVSPEHKLDLVTLFQEEKKVVGMTGDGVNDAPALKKADIGIAMGQRGTQVAKEVADMVLKDDAFSSIVMAIKQGRVIFDNIRKFVIFLLSCNLSELLIISTASILSLHFQLFPLQILFINLVTDVLPALALGVTEGAPNIMHRKPYSSEISIIDKKRWKAISAYSIVIAISSIGAVFFSHELLHQAESWNAELCNNILFYTLIFSQIFHVFNMSFENGIAFHKTEIFKNRYARYAVVSCILITALSYWLVPMRRVLNVSIYGWRDWSIVLGFSFLSLIVIQLLKRSRWVI